MAKTRIHSILAPIDPEINISTRTTLDYYVTLPEKYNNNKPYPIVFCIPGYGDHAGTDYQTSKLRPYIADKYNVIAVGVRYHHDLRTEQNVEFSLENICYFYNVQRSYFNGVDSFDSLLHRLYLLLVERSIFQLDPRVSPKQHSHHQYSSFGFLPAIDHLTVLHDLLKKYQVDKSKINVFGTSYGGYVAMLMGKFAPFTFSVIIENSGFSVTQIKDIFSNRIDGSAGITYPRTINGKRYEIPVVVDTLWTEDETSSFYFSDANRKIRNLLLPEHITPSNTMYFCFHSVSDEIAPISLKDMFYEKMRDSHRIYYNRIEERHIDGKMFKNTSHGMDASLRSLYDYCIDQCSGIPNEETELTDFDIGSLYEFACSDKVYCFQYSATGLKVEIKPRY